MRKAGKALLVALTVALCLPTVMAGCNQNKPTPDDGETQKHVLDSVAIGGDETMVNKTKTFDVDKNVARKDSSFTFPVQFKDLMVLQANAVNCIYGEYETDGGIAVEIVDPDTGYSATYYGEVKDGKFEVYLAPVPYGEYYTVNIYTPTARTCFLEVAFGEVFLMSGQSNMGMSVSECLDPYSQEEVCIYQDLIDSYENEDVRCLKIWPSMNSSEIDSLSGSAGSSWATMNRSTTGSVSACAFFFAKRINEMYNVPVGIIQSCMGGTYTCAWIPPQEYTQADSTYAGNQEANTPSARYNGMIYPLRKTTVRGVCWYQGEGQDVKYFENMSLLISGWRRVFNRPDLPFHIVELPRFIANSYEAWFSVRTQQRRLAEEVENVSYSVNIDRGIFARNEAEGIYNKGILGVDGIHCPDKEPVGTRAADAFAKKFYKSAETLTPPVLTLAERVDGGVLLTFDVGASELVLKDKLCGFEVSANGTNYTYAAPELVGENKVKLNTAVENVRFVRYGFTYACSQVFGGNGQPDKIENLVCLYNKAGYPVDQFLVEIK